MCYNDRDLKASRLLSSLLRRGVIAFSALNRPQGVHQGTMFFIAEVVEALISQHV
jgi:hypothetical protein